MLVEPSAPSVGIEVLFMFKVPPFSTSIVPFIVPAVKVNCPVFLMINLALEPRLRELELLTLSLSMFKLTSLGFMIV